MKNNKREKVWCERYVFGDVLRDNAVREMARELGRSELFSVLLYNRGYRTKEDALRFLRFEEADLHDPYMLEDMDKAVDRVFLALERNEKICIYGDYDVDGVTSVSMLYLYLRELGADVTMKIPKREGEGYGVSCVAVNALADEGVKLIITVDTGITAANEVEFGKSVGVDFVITDHHECRSELPAACAVVNPHRPTCQYPFKELAGVGVVFKLVCACEMRRCREDGRAIVDGIRRVCTEYADLTALGTIADVMPIIDENRLIVSMGLRLMETRPRPGLEALIEASSSKKGEDSKKRKITSGFIGFGIAPRINAAGRISDAAIAVRTLLATAGEEAERYAEELCAINRQRQIEENRIAEKAYEMIEDLPDLDANPVIVLDSNEWQQGIIGIVSSKITERYGLPSILVSFYGSMGAEETAFDDGKGSGRSIKGLNLVEALGHCEDLLVKYGGHELAAGLTVKRGDLDAFRERINAYARECLDDEAFKIKLDVDCEIEMSDVNIDFAKELQYLEPYGTGNATPLFVMRDVTVKKIAYTKGGEHARLYLEKNGAAANAMFFGMGEGMLGFESGDLIDLLFNVDINDYKNVQTAQMIVRDAKLAESYSKRIENEKNRYNELRGGARYYSNEDFVPDRDDCSRVYTLLRREYRLGNSVTDIQSVLRDLNQGAQRQINYVKLKYIFEIFNELQICDIVELDKDIYRFQVIFRATRTSIDKSAILKRLKTQCIDRPQQ
jgi:single-stranded-DNA-specific exonuclease